MKYFYIRETSAFEDDKNLKLSEM